MHLDVFFSMCIVWEMHSESKVTTPKLLSRVKTKDRMDLQVFSKKIIQSVQLPCYKVWWLNYMCGCSVIQVQDADVGGDIALCS